MGNYYYQDETGREIGPFDLATLTKFRQAGVLNGDTPVRLADSREWKSCREAVPDVAPIATPGTATQPNANKAASGVYKILLALAAVIIFVTWQINNAKKTTPDDTEKQFQNRMKSEVDAFNKDQAEARDRLFGGQASTPMRTVPASQNNAEEERRECVNNMKEIGLAFRVWEGDHNDKYPFNVETSSGGTMEYCDRTPDGFDKNSFLHFQVMSNELATTRILICPSDVKQQAMDFAHLRPENVSYQIHSGVNVDESNPQKILAICPIHHVLILTDGSVQQFSNEADFERAVQQGQ